MPMASLLYFRRNVLIFLPSTHKSRHLLSFTSLICSGYSLSYQALKLGLHHVDITSFFLSFIFPPSPQTTESIEVGVKVTKPNKPPVGPTRASLPRAAKAEAAKKAAEMVLRFSKKKPKKIGLKYLSIRKTAVPKKIALKRYALPKVGKPTEVRPKTKYQRRSPNSLPSSCHRMQANKVFH